MASHLSTSLKANGDAGFKSGNYTDAITAYSKAIAVDGTNHLLYSNRSGAWLAIGDGNSALQDAESCIEIEPSFVKGYSRKGAALFALKQYDAASAAYRSGLDLAPADTALQNGLRDAEHARINRTSVKSVSACGHATVARNLDRNAKVGHSAELVHHIIAFLRHREKIDKLWATYSTLGLVEAIPTIDLIETITSGQKDRYDPSMRQMSITATPVTGLHDLYEAAEQALNIYNNILLNDIATAVPDLNPDDIHTTGLKGRPRAAQKAQDDYSNRSTGPGEAWLFDIVRGSIECDNEAQIVAVVDSLRNHPGVEIIRLKNRFKNPTPPGFRDINMNIRIPIGVHEGATVFHICELQVHHKEVKAFAKANGSHHHYEYFRVYFSGGVDALATRMDLFRNIGLFNATSDDAEAPTGDEGQGHIHEGDEPAKDILSKVVDEVVAGEDEKKLEGLRVLLNEVSELGLQERVLRCQRTLVRARLGDLHFETFFVTNLLSINLQKQLKLEEAEALMAESLAAMPLIAFEYESERWVCDMMAERQLASVLCDLSKFEDALSHLLRSWELSKVVYHDHSIEAGRFLGELGNLFVAMGNLSEAAPHLEGQLVACRRELGDESPVTADALMQLAKLYVMEGKYPKAKALTETALGVYRRINGETDKKTAETLAQLGTIYQNLGQGNLAAPIYEQSLKIVRTLLGDNHADTLVALNNVANLHCGEGRWSEALPILLKGCEAARRVVGEQHHLTATFYNNLGAAVFAQAHFDEAKVFFEKSLAIREAVLGHDHPHTGKVSGDLGSALQMLGDLKGARGPLEHSLSVQRAKAGSYSLDTASTLNSLGSLLHKLGELEEAEAKLVEALQINRQNLGDKDLNVGGVLNNLGVLYRDMGRLDKGLACLQNAVQVYSELAGQSNPTTVNVIGNLGSVMMRGSVEEERKQGRLLVEQAVAYFRSQGCGPDHPYVVKFATILAS